MNKKTLNFIAGITAATVVFGAAGCSKNEKTVSEVTDYPGAEITLNGEDIYPISCDDTLTWWKGMSDLGTTFENFGDTPIAKAYEKETGIKIQYIHPSQGQGAEQIQLMMASDELPDIVQHAWDAYPGGPEMAIADDYIYELSDLINKYAPALRKVLDDNKEWDKQIKTDSGKYYSIPPFSEPGLLQICYGPALRGDWVREMGLEMPTTVAEWEEVLKGFKEKGADYPFIGTFSQMLDTFGSGFGFLKSWYHDNGTVKYGVMQPGYKEFLVTMNRWYKEGLIHPDFVTVDGKQINSAILNGKAGAGVFWAGSGMGPILKAAEETGGIELTGVQFPAVKKGEKSDYNYIIPQVIMGNGSAISKKCKNPELAMRLFDFAFTEKGRELACFGIEGESFNWVDGYPTYSENITNNPKDYTVAQGIAAYTLEGHVPFVNDVRYIEQYYKEPAALSKAQREWNKTNMNEHILPSIYVLGEESEKDADIMVNVQTYVDEMAVKFITGEVSFDEYDEFINQIEAFGINDSIKFRQAAYERYQLR